MTTTDPLDTLARRTAGDPFFLGHSLDAYQRRHGLSDGDLCTLLGCDAATLTQLRLCRKPGTAAGWTAAQDVAHLAERYGIDPGALALTLESAP
jgi:hypothetical protein